MRADWKEFPFLRESSRFVALENRLREACSLYRRGGAFSYNIGMLPCKLAEEWAAWAGAQDRIYSISQELFDDSTFVEFDLDTRSAVARAWTGDSSYAVRFKDCCHVTQGVGRALGKPDDMISLTRVCSTRYAGDVTRVGTALRKAAGDLYDLLTAIILRPAADSPHLIMLNYPRPWVSVTMWEFEVVMEVMAAAVLRS